ncbi:MAG: hypothetical protein V1653_00170 [bacterium]
MLNLRRLTIIFLALMVTVSLASPTFAARKRQATVKAEPAAAVETPAPAVKTTPAPQEPAAQPEADINRNEEVQFTFDKDTAGWEIPDWAFEKPQDYVASSLGVSKTYTKTGKGSLEIKANFPGKRWTGAYVEYVEYLDWNKYSEVAVDVFVPANATTGLMAKIILTQGEEWTWVEMRKPVLLTPGKWTTIRANLLPGSTDWRRVQPTEDWRSDIRKFGVRVESDKKAIYNGSVYIGNIRLTLKEH